MNITTLACLNNEDATVTIISELNKVEAKAYALSKIKNIFLNTYVDIGKTSRILSHKFFDDSIYIPYREGKINYIVGTEFNGVSQCINIASTSPLSAFNNIKIKFGIQKLSFAVIIEKNSNRLSKISLKYKTDNTIQNLQETYQILNHVANMPGIEYSIIVMCKLVSSYLSGTYKNILADTVKIIFSSLILLYDNNNIYDIDIINNAGDMTPREYVKFIYQKYIIDIQNFQNCL